MLAGPNLASCRTLQGQYRHEAAGRALLGTTAVLKDSCRSCRTCCHVDCHLALSVVWQSYAQAAMYTVQGNEWLRRSGDQRTHEGRMQQSTRVLTNLLNSTGVHVPAAVDSMLMSSPALLKGRADAFFDEIKIQSAAQVCSRRRSIAQQAQVTCVTRHLVIARSMLQRMELSRIVHVC
jgi:hypothetical protein